MKLILTEPCLAYIGEEGETICQPLDSGAGGEFPYLQFARALDIHIGRIESYFVQMILELYDESGGYTFVKDEYEALIAACCCFQDALNRFDEDLTPPPNSAQ